MEKSNGCIYPKKNITKEEFDILKPRCHCICNQLIVWNDNMKTNGIPNYKKGHVRRTLPIIIDKEEFDRTGPHYCGCPDKEIIEWNRSYRSDGIPKYKRGHHNKGKKFPEEYCKNISKGKTGCITWNKGKKGLQVAWNNGIPCTQEVKDMISIKNKGKRCGSESPHWKGGISHYPYCDKFNNILKEAVRDRDGRTCQLCGKTQEENRVRLPVHHVHYDKENCYPDLICLCIKCNSKVNYNREFYEELFTFILWIRNML